MRGFLLLGIVAERRETKKLLVRVLVGSDAIAHVIGLAVELALVLLGEMTVIFRHVFLFVVLQTLFTVFQTRRLSGRELAVLNAVGDAVLLTGLAAVDLVHARMTRIDLPRSGS